MKIIYLTGLIFISSSAFSSENLFICKKIYDFIIGDCSIKINQIADPYVSYDGSYVELDYKVAYNFACEGHQPEIGIKGSQGWVRFDLGKSDVINISSRYGLQTYDNNPSETSNLSFQPGCNLTISNNLTFSPTLYQIQDWTDSARYQARLIDQGIDLYLLAGDLANYMSWDNSTTTTLLNGVNRKITAFTRLCNLGDSTACRAKIHFTAVANSLQAKLDGAPPPSIGDGDMDAVKQAYLSQLREDVDIGNQMVDRFEYWELAIEGSLEDILASVPGEV